MRRKSTDAEKKLWQQVTEGVQPLQRKEIVVKNTPVLPRRSIRKRIENRQYQELYASIAASPSQISKLMPTGKVQLEGRIDLHGMTLVQAEDQLKRYLLYAQAAHKRWILVITGKGEVLKTCVPDWLDQWPMIAGYRTAKPKDGGAGALYVWVKKAAE